MQGLLPTDITRTLLYCLLLLTGMVRAMPETMVVTENTEQMNLIAISDYLEDPDGLLNVEDLEKPEIASQFQPVGGKGLSSGIAQTIVWLKFELKYISYIGESMGEWLVEVGYPALDLVTLYTRDSWGAFQEFHTGDKYPFDIRDIAHPAFLFPVELVSGEVSQFYLRIETRGSLQVPVKLWTPLAYMEKTNRMDTLFGVMYGILLVMVIYHLMLFFRRKEACYLYYSIFIAGFLIYFLTVNGTGIALIWAGYPQINDSTPFFMSIASVAALAFTQSFLVLHQRSLVISRLFTVLLLGGLLVIPMSFVLPLGYASQMVIAQVQLNLLMIILVGIYCLWQGREQPTQIFLLAFLCQMAGAIFYSLILKGYVAGTELSQVVVPLMMTIVATLLALAMARRQDFFREHEKHSEEDRIYDMQKDNQRLLEATGIKNEFLQALASKLAEPVGSLMDSLNRLDVKDDQNYLKQAYEASERVRGIVENLASLNEIQSSSLSVMKVPFNVRRQMQLLSDKFRMSSENKKLPLEFHIDDKVPENLYGDARKIFRVTANVLDNAIKYTSDGFIAVYANVKPHEEQDKLWLYIVVEDTGVGIREEQGKNIYSAFEQLGNTQEIHNCGAGLGLSVSRQLMHSMGGSISHAPRTKGGTCFEISVVCFRH